MLAIVITLTRATIFPLASVRSQAFLSPSFLMSLALKECGHTQTINIINGVCLMKEELLDKLVDAGFTETPPTEEFLN